MLFGIADVPSPAVDKTKASLLFVALLSIVKYEFPVLSKKIKLSEPATVNFLPGVVVPIPIRRSLASPKRYAVSKTP
mgnify:CR=1 FL=1